MVGVPVVQVHLGSSRPWTRSLTCPLLSTTVVLLTVEVPQIQFRIFRAPPGYPGVERQFSEPSMAKSSLPSRGPAQ